MSKLLLFSHSGFSDENANGITMKNLLSAWNSEDKAEFYCDIQPPDLSAADNYFRITDMQMLASFVGKKSQHIFKMQNPTLSAEGEAPVGRNKAPSRIPAWMKRQKYNFSVKWTREILWKIGPWGHKELEQWIDDFSPDVLVYMVGESIFMDQLVLQTVQRIHVPLVLYNGEAYRIINLRERQGLERAYYRKVEKLYQELNRRAALVIYNCETLLNRYSEIYPPCAEQIVAYNSATISCTKYHPHDSLTITYFGNLGVGRVDSVLQVADALHNIDSDLFIDVYGSSTNANESKMKSHLNIQYHGFVSSWELQSIIEKSDILLHVESFNPKIMPKLRYAFSTKIAQCLCAGRPLLCYAPAGSVSVEYLSQENGALVATNFPDLKISLEKFVSSPDLRGQYAQRALLLGNKNHRCETTAALVRHAIEDLL